MFKSLEESGCTFNEAAPSLSCIFPLFQNVINAALMFAGITALFFVIFSGIKLIRSSGDQKQVEGARKTLTFAILGLVLILLSFFIINFISYLTGVDCIREFGFDQCNQ